MKSKSEETMNKRLKMLKALSKRLTNNEKRNNNSHHNGHHNGHLNDEHHNNHINKNKLNAQNKNTRKMVKNQKNIIKINKLEVILMRYNGMPQRYYNPDDSFMLQSGGDTNWGATGMPQRFYDANDEGINYGLDSGMGVDTAYGKSVPLDAGVGNLAPFNTSKASAPLSMTQTGGMASLNQDVC